MTLEHQAPPAHGLTLIGVRDVDSGTEWVFRERARGDRPNTENTGRCVPGEAPVEDAQGVSLDAEAAIERRLFDEFTLWDNNARGADTVNVAYMHEDALTMNDESLGQTLLAKGYALIKEDMPWA